MGRSIIERRGGNMTTYDMNMLTHPCSTDRETILVEHRVLEENLRNITP